METSFSPLAWYKNIEEQNHRRWYAYGHVHQLCMPLGTILPFQFVRGAKPTEIVSVTLNSLDGDNAIDITTAMFNSGLTLVNKYNSYGFDVINYTSDRALGVSVKEGLYYLTISDNAEVFYSEVFAFVADTSRLLRIEWENYEDMIYNDGITLAGKSVLYLNTELGKPEYTFEEEGTDRDGLFFPEKQLSEKLYKFTFTAPEYLCDSLRLAQMADVVTITDRYGRNYNCDTFHIAVEWQDQGDLAAVEAEFTTSTVLKKVGKGSSAANGEDAPNYLTFTYVKGTSDNGVVYLSVEPTIAERYGWEFSGDGGRHWFEAAYMTVNIAVVNKLMVRGYGCSNSTSNPIFTITGGKVEASGSVMSLFEDVLPDGASYLTTNYNMAYMFSGCSSLVTAPEIPFEALLANGCCNGMFRNCTSLVNAPALPASRLGSSCYSAMFQGCRSLITAPELPVTELKMNCYSMMFQGCQSLITAPELPATTSADYCYSQMFENCTSLVNAPKLLPATKLKKDCYSTMFKGCRSLITAPELPATELERNCYFQMFLGCSSLVNAPELPATRLYDRSYERMFGSCTSLVNAPVMKMQYHSPESCRSMFEGCTALKVVPEIEFIFPSVNSFNSMFKKCTSLESVPFDLPVPYATESSYAFMFSDCSSLIEAPALIAEETTTASLSCESIFRNCPKLTLVTARFRYSVGDALLDWLIGAGPTGTVRCYESAGIPLNSSSGVPSGWTVEYLEE